MRTRKSRILYAAERMAGLLRDLFSKSLLLDRLSHACIGLETAFRRGAFAAVSDAEADRNVWQYRFRTACRQAFEQSLLLRLGKKIGRLLLDSSVASFGSFGVLYGAFSASLWFLKEPDERYLTSLVVSLILTVVSVPLLNVGRSLSFAVRHSILIGGFLFDVCLLPETFFVGDEQGRERHWQGLFCALLAGVGSFVLPPTLFLLSVVLALLLCLFFAVPELPALAILFFLPFLQLLPHPSLALSGCTLLCFVVWLAKALCGRRVLRFGLVDLTVLLFGGGLALGGLVGAGGADGAKSGLLMLTLLSFWFPAVNLFSQKTWRNRAFTALKLSCVTVSVWGIVQYCFGELELRWVDISRFADIGGRVCGPFSNPNVLAVFLLLSAPILAAGAFGGTHRTAARLFDAFGFACAALCLIFTWSRGAWLGILVAALFFLISHSRRSFAVLLLSFVPLVSLLPFLPHSVINRFCSIGSFSESSIRYRFYTWRGVLRMLKAHRWGIGTSSTAFERVYPQYAVSGTETVTHTHQLFLQVLTEQGIVGLLIFLFFLLQLLFFCAYALKHLHGSSRSEVLGASASLIGVLIMGFFDYVWYHFGLFCLFFAVCSVLTVREEDENIAYA